EDAMAVLRETGCRHAADVTEAEDADPHAPLLCCSLLIVVAVSVAVAVAWPWLSWGGRLTMGGATRPPTGATLWVTGRVVRAAPPAPRRRPFDGRHLHGVRRRHREEREGEDQRVAPDERVREPEHRSRGTHEGRDAGLVRLEHGPHLVVEHDDAGGVQRDPGA